MQNSDNSVAFTEELAVATRVRNRLRHSSTTSRLPNIIPTLLPRLLRHTDRNVRQLQNSTGNNGSIHQQIQDQLMASLEFCRQEIQRNTTSEDNHDSYSNPVVDQLLPLLVVDQNDEQKSSLLPTSPSLTLVTLVVSILEVTHPQKDEQSYRRISDMLQLWDQIYDRFCQEASTTYQQIWIRYSWWVLHTYCFCWYEFATTSTPQLLRKSNSLRALLHFAMDLVLFPAISFAGRERWEYLQQRQLGPSSDGVIQQKIHDVLVRELLGAGSSKVGVLHGTDQGVLFSLLLRKQLPMTTTSCSIPLAIALLVLVVGDSNAIRVLGGVERRHGDLLLGQFPEHRILWRPPLQQTTLIMEFLKSSFHPTQHDDRLELFFELLWDFQTSHPDLIGPCLELTERAVNVLEDQSSKPWLHRLQEKLGAATMRFVLQSLTIRHRLFHPINHRDDTAALEWTPEGRDHVPMLNTAEGQLPLYQIPAAVATTRRNQRRTNTIEAFREKRRFHQQQESRLTAYRLLQHLITKGVASRTSVHSTNRQEWIPRLLYCAAAESEAIQPHVLESLRILASSTTASSSASPALLPALVNLVCTRSVAARVAAVSLVRDLTFPSDPLAAQHVWEYLRHDPSAEVMAAATRQLKACNLTLGFSQSSPIQRPDPIHLDRTNPLDELVLNGELARKIDYFATRYSLDSESSWLLLAATEFSESRLEAFLEENCAGTLERFGIQDLYPSPSVAIISCEICYDDYVEGFHCPSPKGHQFCRTCWQEYCNLQEGRSISLVCPSNECNARLPRSLVRIVAPKYALGWEQDVFGAFLQATKCISPCPKDQCPGVVMVLSETNRNVACNICTTPYCFECGQTPHYPASCQAYRKLTTEISQASFWIRLNSKPCPTCSVPIEKTTGCNHMICTQCNTEFCWLCLAVLDTHLAPHTCNIYDPATTQEKRLSFFAQRFHAHKEARLEEENRPPPCEELDQAVHILLEARSFLANSYVAAWEISPDSSRFQDIATAQVTLELLTQQLSLMTNDKQFLTQAYEEGGHAAVTFTIRSVIFVADTVSKYSARLCEVITSEKPEI